jgi:hypothetical protein
VSIIEECKHVRNFFWPKWIFIKSIPGADFFAPFSAEVSLELCRNMLQKEGEK